MNAAEGSDATSVMAAVDRFLDEERAFLVEASERLPGLRGVLSCALLVYPFIPTSIVLPSSVCQKLHQYGIDWEVSGYPCSDET